MGNVMVAMKYLPVVNGQVESDGAQRSGTGNCGSAQNLIGSKIISMRLI